jgi:hypothetical protein
MHGHADAAKDNRMDQWEYWPTFLEARADRKDVKAFLNAHLPHIKKYPRYMAESMIPELNHLGDQGWELVHMEPVQDVGRKGEVMFDGEGLHWSNVYFCVFKRRKPAPEPEPPPPSTPLMPDDDIS